MTNEELNAHVVSKEFKRRCRSVVERQMDGEIFTIPEIACELSVPLWFAECALMVWALAKDTQAGRIASAEIN